MLFVFHVQYIGSRDIWNHGLFPSAASLFSYPNLLDVSPTVPVSGLPLRLLPLILGISLFSGIPHQVWKIPSKHILPYSCKVEPMSCQTFLKEAQLMVQEPKSSSITSFMQLFVHFWYSGFFLREKILTWMNDDNNTLSVSQCTSLFYLEPHSHVQYVESCVWWDLFPHGWEGPMGAGKLSTMHWIFAGVSHLSPPFISSSG